MNEREKGGSPPSGASFDPPASLAALALRGRRFDVKWGSRAPTDTPSGSSTNHEQNDAACVLFKSHISADEVAAGVHVESYLCSCPIVSHRAPGCCIFNQVSSLNGIFCRFCWPLFWRRWQWGKTKQVLLEIGKCYAEQSILSKWSLRAATWSFRCRIVRNFAVHWQGNEWMGYGKGVDP